VIDHENLFGRHALAAEAAIHIHEDGRSDKVEARKRGTRQTCLQCRGGGYSVRVKESGELNRNEMRGIEAAASFCSFFLYIELDPLRNDWQGIQIHPKSLDLSCGSLPL